MDVPAEDDGSIPLVELVQQIVGLLAGEGRGKLCGRRPEDVGMAKDKRVADFYSRTVLDINIEKM